MSRNRNSDFAPCFFCRVVLFIATLALFSLVSRQCTVAQATIAEAQANADQQDQPNSKVRLVTSLSNQDVRSLQFGQRLLTEVPAGSADRIGIIQLQRENRLKDEASRLEARTRYDRGILFVEIDSQLIERLAYQPIEFKISRTNLRKVVFLPTFAASIDRNRSEQAAGEKKFKPEFYFRLKPAVEFSGNCQGIENFQLKTEFGTVDIPLADVAGLRLGDGDNEPTFVVFKNGDTVSGTCILPQQIEITTKWGNEKLESNRFISMTRGRDWSFTKQFPQDSRWRLSNIRPRR